MMDGFTFTAEMLLHYKKQPLDFPKYFNYSRQTGERLSCWITEDVWHGMKFSDFCTMLTYSGSPTSILDEH